MECFSPPSCSLPLSLLSFSLHLIIAPDVSTKSQAQTCRAAWKRLIRHWEQSFEEKFGHKVKEDPLFSWGLVNLEDYCRKRRVTN